MAKLSNKRQNRRLILCNPIFWTAMTLPCQNIDRENFYFIRQSKILKKCSVLIGLATIFNNEIVEFLAS